MRFDDYDSSDAMAAVARLDAQNIAQWLQQPTLRGYWFLAIIGLVWGLLTGFASLILPGMGQISMFGGLIVAMILSVLYFRSIAVPFACFTKPAGLFILMHAMAALMSCALSEQPVLIVSMRYFALAIAFSLVLYVVQQGPGAINAMRVGFTAAGLAVIVFHLGYVSMGGLSNPFSRIGVYLNPNSLGMIGAITSLSLTDYAIDARKNRQRGRVVAIRACIVACLLIVLATKSRTAAFSLIAGWMLLRTLRFGFTRIMILGIVLVGLALLLPEARESGLRIYQFDSQSWRWRDPTTLTGRTRVWRSYLNAFEENPAFGIGPGGLAATIGASGHNAIIQYLAEVGLVGTVPAVLLILMAVHGAVKNRRDPTYYFAIACLGAALVESLTESSLLNSGNPIGLLELLCIANLATPRLASEQTRPMADADGNAADSYGLLLESH